MSEMCLSAPIVPYYEQQMLFPRRFGKPSEFADMVKTVIENPLLNGVNIKITAALRQHCRIRYPEEDYIPEKLLLERKKRDER